MNTPLALAPTVNPPEHRAQATAEQELDMLSQCIPTLKAEYYAALFMRAELTRAGDVQVRKSQFMKAAGRIIGAIPPMSECALQIIAAPKLGKKS